MVKICFKIQIKRLGKERLLSNPQLQERTTELIIV